MGCSDVSDERIAHRAEYPIDPVMRFTDAGLVLGAGTVLYPAGATAREISIDVSDRRLLTLLATAHLQMATPSALAHLHKAAERWSEGKEVLAAVHLALSRLDRLKRPAEDAQRLFFADCLLTGGPRAQSLINNLKFESQGQVVSKYNPDQPRVPAGSGRTSGQWSAGGSSSSPSQYSSSAGERSSDGNRDTRTFTVELPWTITCGPAPPISPFTQAVKALADSVEIADSVSKWQELGPKGEVAIQEAVKARGWVLLGIRIPVRTSLGLRVEDVFVRVPAGTAGNAKTYDGFIEVKVNGGRYSALQQAKDAVIGTEGGTFVNGVDKYRAGDKEVLETGLANVTITYERKIEGAFCLGRSGSAVS